MPSPDQPDSFIEQSEYYRQSVRAAESGFNGFANAVAKIFPEENSQQYKIVLCNDCLHEHALDKNHGRCPICFVNCTMCREYVTRDESWQYRSEIGGTDYFCRRCYCNRFTNCLTCERIIDHMNLSCWGYDTRYCSPQCRPRKQFEQDKNWLGIPVYDEIKSTRKFGVEIETHTSPNYQNWIEDSCWGAKIEGSTRGMEFVSPALYGDDGLESIRSVCKQIEGYSVNSACGLHIHIDLTKSFAEERKAIALAYHYTRIIWGKFVNEDRRDTEYSLQNDDSECHWNEQSILEGDDCPYPYTRYIWVNWLAYREHNTVEIRSHEGTLDAEAICNWIKAHTRFIDAVSKMSVGEVTRLFRTNEDYGILEQLDYIWDDDELYEYFCKKGGFHVLI